MDPQAFHILSIGGALQLAGIAATVTEVGAAYRRLRGKWPVVRLLRDWWPPWRRPQSKHVNVGIVATVQAADELDAAGTVTPSPPPIDFESRLRRVEDAINDHEDRLWRTEERVSASDVERAELSEDIAELRTDLDDAEIRLRRLINAVEAGNVPVRVFAALALLLGVGYATWHVWIADNAYWPAIFLAGFAVGYHTGWLVVYRRRRAAP